MIESFVNLSILICNKTSLFAYFFIFFLSYLKECLKAIFLQFIFKVYDIVFILSHKVVFSMHNLYRTWHPVTYTFYQSFDNSMKTCSVKKNDTYCYPNLDNKFIIYTRIKICNYARCMSSTKAPRWLSNPQKLKWLNKARSCSLIKTT